MERLSVNFVCENLQNKSGKCDFSYRGLVTFPGSNIVPKCHLKIANSILDRKKEKKIIRNFERTKLEHPEIARNYASQVEQLYQIWDIVDKVGRENIYASALLDVGFWCPKCHKFQTQLGLFMTWKDKDTGIQKMFKFNHNCVDCGAELVKLTGTSKQTSKLLCPKCGGHIKVDNASIVDVTTTF